MNALLEQMEKGFDNYFDKLNKIPASEIVLKLDELGLLIDAPYL